MDNINLPVANGKRNYWYITFLKMLLKYVLNGIFRKISFCDITWDSIIGVTCDRTCDRKSAVLVIEFVTAIFVLYGIELVIVFFVCCDRSCDTVFRAACDSICDRNWDRSCDR